MSYTNTTPNYSLPQYVGTDKPSFLGDFNSAMRTIDEALEANKTTAGDAAGKLEEDENLLQETQHRADDANSAIEALESNVSTASTNASDASEKATQAFQKATEAQSEAAAANATAGQANTTAGEANRTSAENESKIEDLTARVENLEKRGGNVIYKSGSGPWDFSEEFPEGIGFDVNNCVAILNAIEPPTYRKDGYQSDNPEIDVSFTNKCTGTYNSVKSNGGRVIGNINHPGVGPLFTATGGGTPSYSGCVYVTPEA